MKTGNVFLFLPLLEYQSCLLKIIALTTNAFSSRLYDAPIKYWISFKFYQILWMNNLKCYKGMKIKLNNKWLKPAVSH